MTTCRRHHLNVFIRRNPGVDPGEERWDVDELSHPHCPRKGKQVFPF